jgi:tetratricopeptide (TPR) repeat protein
MHQKKQLHYPKLYKLLAGIKAITFILLLSISQSSFSQTLSFDNLIEWSHPGNTDSIMQALEAELPDTLRAQMIRALCIRYSESDVDSSMKYGQQFYLFCKSRNWQVDEAWALDFMGAMYLKTGNAVKAMEMSLAALKMYEKMKDATYRAINYKLLGDAFTTQNDPRGIEYYQRSIEVAMEDNLGKFYKSWTMIALGTVYLNQHNLDSAMYYAQGANQIFQTLLNARFINLKYYPECLNLLGKIHQRTGNNQLALEYYRLAIDHALTYENLPAVSMNYMDMAHLFKANNMQDSALKYARHAYTIASSLDAPFLIVGNSRFLKEYYKNNNRLDSAFKYQEIMLAAKDTLLSMEKIRQVQNLAFDEQLRQQEMQAAQLKAHEARNTNLQFAAIAIGLITFIILFLILSRSILVKTKFIEFFGVLGLLAVFEFINLFIHPYLAEATNHSPLLMLLVLIGIGAMLVPLHHRLEKWITKKMIEKNKAIRLAVAKRTIRQLESDEVQS